MQKIHTTAIVLIPPAPLWGPVQAIRATHDRGYRRWMPHITLLYPFLPRAVWEEYTPLLAQACRTIAAFTLTLGAVDAFRRGSRPATIYLAPTPTAPLLALQRAVLAAAPMCDDTSRHAGGFTPHLTVAQSPAAQVGAVLARMGNGWHPLHWSVTSVALIWRNDPPDDVFRVATLFPLGEEAQDGAASVDGAGSM